MKPNAFRVNYFADGTGRDTFVKTDNGGFFKAYAPAPAPPVTSFVTKRRYDKPAPVMKSRAVFYHSDGSGRDNYITINAGGLANPGSKTIDYVTSFKQSLRKIDRPQSAYSKMGGFSGGIKKTPSVTKLRPKQGDPTRRNDILA